MYFCLAAGAGDSTTGGLLLLSPSVTLGFLGIADVATHAVYLRFIGVFVGAVGLAYAAPWFLPRWRGNQARLMAMIELTAFVRLAVALFVAAACIVGALASPWLTVGIFDASVALVQLAMRANGVFGRVS
jgi:hypothetical protein